MPDFSGHWFLKVADLLSPHKLDVDPPDASGHFSGTQHMLLLPGFAIPVPIRGQVYGPERMFVRWETIFEQGGTNWKFAGWWDGENNWQGHWTDGTAKQGVWIVWRD